MASAQQEKIGDGRVGIEARPEHGYDALELAFEFHRGAESNVYAGPLMEKQYKISGDTDELIVHDSNNELGLRLEDWLSGFAKIALPEITDGEITELHTEINVLHWNAVLAGVDPRDFAADNSLRVGAEF